MTWIKNNSIGIVRIADLNIELDFNDTLWIEPEDFQKSKDLKKQLAANFLSVISEKKINQQIPTKERKKSLPSYNKSFPFGIASRIHPREIEKIVTIKLLEAFKKLFPKDIENQLTFSYTKEMNEKDVAKALTEQQSTLSLFEKLTAFGIIVKYKKEDITKTRLLESYQTYLPTTNQNIVQAKVKPEPDITKAVQLDEATEQFKKIRKSSAKEKELPGGN